MVNISFQCFISTCCVVSCFGSVSAGTGHVWIFLRVWFKERQFTASDEMASSKRPLSCTRVWQSRSVYAVRRAIGEFHAICLASFSLILSTWHNINCPDRSDLFPRTRGWHCFLVYVASIKHANRPIQSQCVSILHIEASSSPAYGSFALLSWYRKSIRQFKPWNTVSYKIELP